MRLFLLFSLLFISSFAYASDAKFLSSFATIPVLHEGRIKPLDSFARATLRALSGKDSLGSLSASEWLLETLLDPATASQRPLFKIRNPELHSMLSLPDAQLYSFSELLPEMIKHRDIINSIIDAPQDQWTQSQSDLIRLQQDMASFEQLMSSLSALLPLRTEISPSAPDYLKPFSGKNITFLDILPHKQKIDKDIKTIIAAKGNDINTYTPDEQTIAFLSFSLDQLSQKGEQNDFIRLIPAEQNQEWQSPWQVLLSEKKSPLLELWATLATTDNLKDWNTTVQLINSETSKASHASQTRISLEYTYNLLHPHEASFALYILALILSCAGILIRKSALLSLAGIITFAGVLIHIAGVIARIYILARPPVSTLYETILFVGAIVVPYGLVLWFKNRDITILIGSCILGVLLHIISFAKIGDGDSMIMLEAVLNTKFWLATHVLCITTGYAFCLIASAFAHYILAARNVPSYIQTSAITVSLLALFFATTGTILGGIWADQSWGRFWGWDPKENGAMLITLWLIWVIHGRICGRLNPNAFQAMLAYTSVIVALSWFGVNLLGIGLHSYGFTQNLAIWLGIFIAFETTLIAGLWYRRRTHAC